LFFLFATKKLFYLPAADGYCHRGTEALKCFLKIFDFKINDGSGILS
jgi:hypothetical protein